MAIVELDFCPVCSNMMYYMETGTSLPEEERVEDISLVMYCRRCAYTIDTKTEEGEDPNIIVFEKNYESEHIEQDVSEDAFDDPAVPTTTEVSCPTEECDSSTAKFIVINLETHTTVYKCETCNKMWKS